MRPRHWLFLFLGLLTLMRLALIGGYELSPDEAYYYMWSQRPALSYFSKGPGVALTIGAGTSLFGATPFGIRFFSPLLALGTSLILFFFAKHLYRVRSGTAAASGIAAENAEAAAPTSEAADNAAETRGEHIAIWTVLTMNVLPIFNVGSVVMTIDPLSIFFWAAAMAVFWPALEKSPRFSFWWPLAGLLIGFGFLAKYTNAMLLLSIVLVLATARRFQPEFKRPGFYTLLAGFAVCTVPVILWNHRNAWITVQHLRTRGGLDEPAAIDFGELGEFLGAHLGVYSPLVFIGLLLALWWSRKKAAVQFKTRFLVIFTVPLLVVYLVLSLKQAGEANWTAPAFLSLGILAAALWYDGAQRSSFKARYAVAALTVGLVMSVLVVNTDVLRAVGVPWPYEKDPGARLRGWKTSAAAVQEVRQKFESTSGQPVFLIANRYGTAAILSFYLPEKRVEGPGHPAVYIPESQHIENQFSFWPRYDEFVPVPPGTPPVDAYYTEESGVNRFIGRNALYITDREEDNPPTSIEQGFQRVEMISLLQVSRRGLPLRRLRVFACYNYRTLPL